MHTSIWKLALKIGVGLALLAGLGVWVQGPRPAARALALTDRPAWVATPAPYVPDGFQLLMAGNGVALYQQELDFVQRIDLSQGASVALLHGPVMGYGPELGVYGGENPDLWRQPLQEVWDEFSASNREAFCVTNGQFFSSTLDNPTPLAFALKAGGRIISEGYGVDKYAGQQLMLELWPEQADISPLTPAALYTSSASDIIVGLPEDAGLRPEYVTGRTFVGVSDHDYDGQFGIILIFNSRSSTQMHAAEVLRAFGADKVLMLDGGDSTQLICHGALYAESKSGRAIPQTMAVAGGPSPQTFCAYNLWLPVAFDLRPGHRYKVMLEGTQPELVRVALDNGRGRNPASYWLGDVSSDRPQRIFFTASNLDGGQAGQLHLSLESVNWSQACVSLTFFDVTACPTVHLVQPGDTLSSIASRYAADARFIAYANHILNPSLIFVGQAVCVP